MKKQIVFGAMIVLTMMVLMSVAPPAGRQIYIAPADTTVFHGLEPDTFVISVCVTDEITGLMGWDIRVRFDSTFITLTNVTEGALPSDSGYETFFYWYDSGVPDDKAHINGAILGNTVDGPGVLFDLMFVKAAPGSSYVELFDTEIRTGVNGSISHTVTDGLVVVEKTIAVEGATWGEVKAKYR